MYIHVCMYRYTLAIARAHVLLFVFVSKILAHIKHRSVFNSYSCNYALCSMYSVAELTCMHCAYEGVGLKLQQASNLMS